MIETSWRLGQEKQRAWLIRTCVSGEFANGLNKEMGSYLDETPRKVEI